MEISRFLKTNLDIYHTYLLIKKGWNRLLYNDRSFFRKQYKSTFGVYPDLENPKTYCEKLVWSMLNYRNEMFVQCADKYNVREFVKRKVGEKYLVQCYNIYERLEDVDFEKLPSSFVIKATHGSGWNLICSNKKNLNIARSLKMLKFWLAQSYYEFDREWLYKGLKKRIICEEFIGSEDGTPPLDYKIFCFGGVPKLIQLDIARFKKHKRNIYDVEWNLIKQVETKFEKDLKHIYQKPKNLDEMLIVAAKLSKGFEHVRVDLYNVDGKIYFGEMTFFHGGGVNDFFKPKEFELLVGSWFNLPKANHSEGIPGLCYIGRNDYFDYNDEAISRIL